MNHLVRKVIVVITAPARWSTFQRGRNLFENLNHFQELGRFFHTRLHIVHMETSDCHISENL